MSCFFELNLLAFLQLLLPKKDYSYYLLAFLANQISINQEIKKLKDEFDKIDANKDGEISKEELIKCLETIYPKAEAIKRTNEIS